ncbi:hypothetical protein ACXN5S_17315 [Pseudoroseicyclus sp. H15]
MQAWLTAPLTRGPHPAKAARAAKIITDRIILFSCLGAHHARSGAFVQSAPTGI